MTRCTCVTFLQLAAVVVALTTSGVTSSANDSSQWRLAKRLLRGYERVPPPGGPVVVEVGVYINYFYEISEQTMDYSLSMYVRQQWYDSRLSFDVSHNNNNTKIKMPDLTWTKIWIPDIYFRNELSASFHSITTPNRLLFIHNDGRVWYVSKITAKLSCPMLLHKYPLDTQKCPMIFSSFDYSQKDLLLRWIMPINKTVQFDPGGEDRSQFTRQGFNIDDCSYNSTEAYPPGAYSCLSAEFVISRNIGYFMIQFYVPSVLLVILSWVSFWISVDAVVARVNIGLLTVLTLTTQSTGSAGQLPRVSYIKAIDVWMSSCLVFAFASLIEFALVNVWSRRGVRNKARQLLYPHHHHHLAHHRAHGAGRQNKKFEEISQHMQGRRQTTLTVPGHDCLAVLTPGGDYNKPNFGRRISVSLTRRLSIQLPLTPRPVERASSIDRLSRVIFPVSFLLFNLVYWLYYIYVI